MAKVFKLVKERETAPPQIHIFASSINIDYSTQGMSGGDTHLIHLIGKLRNRNHYVRVYVPRIGKRSLQSFGVKADFSVTSSLSKKNGAIVSFLWYTVKSFLAPTEIPEDSIAYSASEFPPAVLPAFLAKRRTKGVRWVAAFHLAVPNPSKAMFGFKGRHVIPFVKGLLSYLSQKFSIFLMRLSADLILTPDNSTRDTVQDNSIPFSRIRIVRIGVSQRAISSPRDLSENRSYDACFVGRFHPQKGLPDLLEAWKDVCDERNDAKLAIVGNGDSGRSLNRAIMNMGLSENIDLVGFKVGHAFYDVLESSRILVFPSHREGNPIVPLEAMACGLPVVAYDLPVLEEMYNHRGILTVPIGNVREFSKKILLLLKDDALYGRVSREAIETASRYDWDSQLEPAVKAMEEL